MSNLLEEGFNLGLGVATAAYNQVDGLVKSALDKVGLKVENKEELGKKFTELGKETRERIEKECKAQGAKLAEYMPLSGKLDEVLAKLDKLEAEVAALKKDAAAK